MLSCWLFGPTHAVRDADHFLLRPSATVYVSGVWYGPYTGGIPYLFLPASSVHAGSKVAVGYYFLFTQFVVVRASCSVVLSEELEFPGSFRVLH